MFNTSLFCNKEVTRVHAIHYTLHPAVYHPGLSSIDNWHGFMLTCVCVLMSNEVKMSCLSHLIVLLVL